MFSSTWSKTVRTWMAATLLAASVFFPATPVTAGVVPGDGAPHPILSDVRVRQAVAYCTDRDALMQSVYPFLNPAQRATLLMDTFLPTAFWAHITPAQTYAHNPAAGRQLLVDAGWTLAPGAQYRTNGAGKELAFSLTTTTAAFRATYLAVLQTQLADCGIHLTLQPTSASWFFGSDTGLVRRDFETSVFAWVSNTNPGKPTLYGCDQVPTPLNRWSGQNYMGWCNDAADAALLQMNGALTRTVLAAAAAVVQEQFAQDMVSLPLFTRVEVYGTDRNLTGFTPNAMEPRYTWNAAGWAVPGSSLIVLAMTQEPATLFSGQDSSFVGSLVRALIDGVGAAHLPNGDLQPVLYASIPTIENGGIVVTPVSVTAGNLVYDSGTGAIVPLAPGVKVLTSAGQTVAYSAGSLTVPQVQITGAYRSGLTWSNGAPLIQADLQLWDQIQCDASSVGHWNCGNVLTREYLSATTTRVTLYPGYMPVEPTAYLPGAYPSQRVISGGRTLGQVPVAEWATLPEVTTSPIGLGPYRLTTWEHGTRMVFTANPSYALGAPATANLEIHFIGDAGQIATQLSLGTVDVAGAETGVLATDILNADAGGTARAYVVPSSTWEHLDFNLTVFERLRIPVLLKDGH